MPFRRAARAADVESSVKGDVAVGAMEELGELRREAPQNLEVVNWWAEIHRAR
jgi:hypothetical protein